MGERPVSGDVSDGPQRVTCAQVLVHLDGLRAWIEPNRVQAQVAEFGPSPAARDGMDDPFTWDYLARLKDATRMKVLLKGIVTRTLAWARRAKAAHRREGQALFGIVQGGTDAPLRRRAVDATVGLGLAQPPRRLRR